MVPVIFSAFANDNGRPLEGLIKERDALMGIFDHPKETKLRILENSNFDSKNDTILIEQLQEQIVVFHFGGHSNGKYINLTNSELQVEALVRLLETFTNLRLIFLNGCENLELALKIQNSSKIEAAIIATISPLNDDIAVSFAYYFYF